MHRKDRKELSIDELKKVVDDSIKLGALHFCISGGEPLLYEDKLVALVEYISQKHAYSAIVTNGQKLQKPLLLRLKAAGLKLIVVSIDSHDPKKHDENRRHKGCYAAAINGIRLAKELGFNIFVNTVIEGNDWNKNNLMELKNKNSLLGAQTHINFMAGIGKMRNTIKKAVDSEDPHLREILRLNSIHSCSDRNYFGKCCPAGKEKILISAYGDIMPCALIQISYGNIRDEPLKNAFNRMGNDAFFRQKNKFCLPVADKVFINRYISKVRKSDKLPLDMKSLH
jgi:MoaA/NifB/PqqE/SkfB family radical SAM enzyme